MILRMILVEMYEVYGIHYRSNGILNLVFRTIQQVTHILLPKVQCNVILNDVVGDVYGDVVPNKGLLWLDMVIVVLARFTSLLMLTLA